MNSLVSYYPSYTRILIMPHKKWKMVLSAVVWCVSLLLAGCASVGTVKNVSPPVGGAISAKDEISVETLSGESLTEAQRSLVEALIISGLQQSAGFKRIYRTKNPDSASANLKLVAKIIDSRSVSDAERAILGALAGRARLVIQVTITDSKSGAAVASFLAEGLSSGGSIFAGTTEQALQRAAEQVGPQVAKLRQ